MALYFNTAAEYAQAQAQALLDVARYQQPFELAVRTTLAVQQVRIFTEGRKSDGGQIGQYDTTRGFYADPKLAPRATGVSLPGLKLEGLKPPTGKTGQTTFKNGKPHKTTWVNNYKDYRNRIGRRVDRVDLVLTADLRLDWSTGLDRGKAVVKPTGLEFFVGFKRPVNGRKREGLEEKYGRIFDVTTSEAKLFTDTLRTELARPQPAP